jgi:hypothetical protein
MEKVSGGDSSNMLVIGIGRGALGSWVGAHLSAHVEEGDDRFLSIVIILDIFIGMISGMLFTSAIQSHFSTLVLTNGSHLSVLVSICY